MFNIFTDLFYFIKEAKLSNYADDNQLYFADTDPAVVEYVVGNKELAVVSEWFRNNKMILNPENAKPWFYPENPMSSYHYMLKVLHYHYAIQ